MNKKYLIVGGVAGGSSAAARLRRLGEEAEIIMFEMGPHVSFSNCSLPYRLSGEVKNTEDLVMMTPEKFKGMYNIDARVNNEVIAIDRDKKEIEVKNLLDVRETYELEEEGQIKNVHNIPLSQLRDRYKEIPKDIPVYVHCRSGQRSYNAVMALQAKGYKDVYNISAGFMGVRSYEYYRDLTTGRDPIVNSYGY